VGLHTESGDSWLICLQLHVSRAADVFGAYHANVCKAVDCMLATAYTVLLTGSLTRCPCKPRSAKKAKVAALEKAAAEQAAAEDAILLVCLYPLRR